MMKMRFYLLGLILLSKSAWATIILVADYAANAVTAYELTTGEQVGLPFPLNEDLSAPLGLAVNPSKTILYVANQSSGDITRYDLLTGKELDVFASGLFNPSGITLNADGKVLYVANFGNNTAQAYDTATKNVLRTFTGGNGCSDVALSPNGTVLYVSNYNGANTLVYNALTGASLGFSIPTGSSTAAIALSLDGSILYACRQSTNTINTYNALTGAAIDSPFLDAADGLNSPYAMRLSEDGTVLYVGNVTGNSVLAFSVSTAEPIGSPFPITEGISFPASFAFGRSPVTSPSNLSGYQKTDDFALQYELFNRLSWLASPSETVGYYVYRNGTKIATLDAFTLSYTECWLHYN